MPLPDAPASARLLAEPATVRGWGGGSGAQVSLVSPRDLDELRDAIAAAARPGASGGAGRRGAIARGLGRSYGDAAQLANGLVLQTTRLKGFDLDPEQGIVSAQAGVSLAELLDALVPKGWIVPVLPGTQHVTVGGAIASDIHGKNHGSAGTFGAHVLSIGLIGADGELRELERGEDLFEATVGGMGLTGVIVWARIQFRAVEGPMLAVDTDRVGNLDEALAALSESGGPHRVAWLDLLSSSPGRGVVTRAEHVSLPAHNHARRGSATVRARARVPEAWPEGILRPSTVRAFNELRFRLSPRRERGRIESVGSHMFPLDGLDAWPRLYGRSGFVQYQLVVPPQEDRVLYSVLDTLRRAAVPCFLAVLKDFGPANSAPLSFPIEGWTLALDLPRSAPGLEAALDQCDQLVAQAGGRVYLTKDARLRPETLAGMYPRLNEWRTIRDEADPEGLWRSDLGARVGLVSPP